MSDDLITLCCDQDDDEDWSKGGHVQPVSSETGTGTTCACAQSSHVPSGTMHLTKKQRAAIAETERDAAVNKRSTQNRLIGCTSRV